MARPLMEVEKRERTKKNSLKVLREEGFVPGIIYGHDKETKNIRFKRKEADRILSRYGIGSSIDIKMDNEVQNTLIKDIQRHITKHNILHVDLQELRENEKVRVNIPLYLINKDKVESSTAVIQQQITELQILTYPKYLVQNIEVDISHLAFGEPLKIRDLEIVKNEYIEVINDLEGIVALLTTSSKLEINNEESKDDLLKRLY